MYEKSKNYINEHALFIALLFALGLGLFLRFKGLTFQSYWFDEIFSIKISNPNNSVAFVYEKTMGDVHPPFYQSLLWFWYQIFGFNEYAGRALSALSGSLGVFVLYLLGKELYNKEVGIYASFIGGTNYFLILYSQEVRSNIILFLFSALSYLYFSKLLKNHSKQNLFFYLLFSILAIYTHYFGFFLVASQVFVFLFYLIIDKEKRVALFKLALLSAFLMLIALAPLIERIIEHIHTQSYWMQAPDALFFIDYLKAYILSPFLEKIFLLLAVVSIGSLFFKKLYSHSTALLFLWIVMGFLLPYIKSITGFSILIERSMIIVIPALIVLVAYGIYLLKVYWLKIAVIGAIVFLALYHLYRMDYYSKVSKDQFRETLVAIEQTKKDAIVYDFIMHNLHDNRYKSNFFENYGVLLGSKLKIRPAVELKDRCANDTMPQYFWVVHAHKDFLWNARILQKEQMQKVLTIDKHQAQAILYTYQSDSQKCQKDKNESTNTINSMPLL